MFKRWIENIKNFFGKVIKYAKNIFDKWFKTKLVKGYLISYAPSKSNDVVSYFLYYEKFPKEVSYESTIVDLGQVTEIDLTSYLYVSETYNIGISAVDEVGNESNLQLLTVTIKK